MNRPPNTFRWQALPTRLLEWACIVMMFALILDVLWGIVSRFVLAAPSRWTDELATALLIWVAMLGAAVAHAQNAHLGVHWLLERVDPRVARGIGRFIHVTIIVFVGVVMVYGGFMLVTDRFRSGQILPALGWSKAWVYLAVPVSGVFIIAYSIFELIWPTPPASPDSPASANSPAEGNLT